MKSMTNLLVAAAFAASAGVAVAQNTVQPPPPSGPYGAANEATDPQAAPVPAPQMQQAQAPQG